MQKYSTKLVDLNLSTGIFQYVSKDGGRMTSFAFRVNFIPTYKSIGNWRDFCEVHQWGSRLPEGFPFLILIQSQENEGHKVVVQFLPRLHFRLQVKRRAGPVALGFWPLGRVQKAPECLGPTLRIDNERCQKNGCNQCFARNTATLAVSRSIFSITRSVVTSRKPKVIDGVRAHTAGYRPVEG